jgi:hypothetical protein
MSFDEVNTDSRSGRRSSTNWAAFLTSIPISSIFDQNAVIRRESSGV